MACTRTFRLPLPSHARFIRQNAAGVYLLVRVSRVFSYGGDRMTGELPAIRWNKTYRNLPDNVEYEYTTIRGFPSPLQNHLEVIGRVNKAGRKALILIPCGWDGPTESFIRLPQEEEDEMIGILTVLMLESSSGIFPEFI